ncbi:unnamed protein product [Rotaria socialis]|uniref:Uncharacterized protein n=1 Tax=Rotaria socialis TaxID=392032 RepID=A0A821KWZ8_9BILA|nr:unnamed protein product [Rotaria socialis]CAF3295541.1 unnamed protein product [Rotaria socialis]CAF3405819.1 unnamed protein product [Rotaria socialis]CAF3500591.1 unnamed protein product [Rotaria socialis]CAF3522889.1 unnamed protein product [Rotaria socialis]
MVLVRKRRGGRRHKKLKAIDPFYSGPRKLLVDKKLVGANQAPKKGEKIDSKVSHRFQQFLDNKTHVEELTKSSKKKNKNKFKQNTVEEGENPELEQKTNESDRNYIQRLDHEIKFALDRARYESKYDVKLVNTEKGDHQYEVKKEKSHRAEKRLKRLQSKKDDNKLKKEEKKIKDDEFKFFQDKPKFGEIVHEPPTLTLPRRSKLNKDAAGMKDLLLKEKLKNVNSFSGSYRKKDN